MANLERRLKRLDFLAQLFRQHDFDTIADEIESLQKEPEVTAFYNVLKSWFF